ncbi:hypothetical protein CYCD_04760 [Tenuifilaceae bacterium CYCD]|nr:hypothetical protein CYCD_04760 [Tenuifilaceae bacterium CYCD]
MPFKKIPIATFIIVISFCSLSKASIKDSSFVKRLVFSVEPQWGFVVPHHDYMSYFIEKNITGFQANIGLLTLGTKDWHHLYNYPQIGMGFYYSSLGNDGIYGKMNALYLYVDRKFLPYQNRFNIGNRIAFGASYITKHYDKESNPLNIVIATSINAFIQYDLMLYYSISPNLNLRGYIGFTHTSNGSIKDPNKGFNIITSGLGLQYTISSERHTARVSPDSYEYSNSHKISIGSVYGCKSITRLDNKVYHIAGVTGEYLYQINPTTLIGGEVVAYWDSSNKEEADAEDQESFEKIDYLNITLNPTYALKMGRVLFTFQPGLYLKNSVKPYGIVTNKVGIRYQIAQKYYASIAIKAHWLAKADFIEFGFRYNILD